MELVYQRTSPLNSPREIYLLCVFRDEALLLKYFIEYYRRLGVTHFIMVDNLSADGGPNYLKSLQDINIRIYRTNGSYREAEYGVAWINRLLAEHCRDRYCLVVDADELFVFDSRIHCSLRSLCEAMEMSCANVVPVNVVDMYPRQIGSPYTPGSDFLCHSCYFDQYNPEYYIEWGPVYGTFTHKVGGVRQRVFGVTVCLHKFSLFKYDFYPLGVAPGYHFFKDGGEILHESSKIRLFAKPSILLHFKFIKPNFKEFISTRIKNNQDWNDSSEYRVYQEVLDNNDEISLFREKYSSKFNNIEDLSPFFK